MKSSTSGNSSSASRTEQILTDWSKGITAKSIMTNNPITVNLDDTIETAVELLDTNNIRHLPVVKEGELLGIVSDRDLKEVTGSSVVELIDNPALARVRLQAPVSSVYRTDFISVDPDTSLEEILDLLLDERVGALPVVEIQGTQLLGIISYLDVLREIRQLI